MKTSTQNSVNDEALLLDLQQGGDAGFARVYKMYFPVLYSHAFRMLDSEQNAEDIVQEIFINLHQKKDEIREGTHLGKYLYFVLKHRILNQIRYDKTYQAYLDNYKNFSVHYQDSTLDLIYEKDLQKILDKEIMRLPTRMREIYELSRNKYLSYQEIAEKLNISEHTVKTQMKNTLRVLRSKLPEIVFVGLVAKGVIQRFF